VAYVKRMTIANGAEDLTEELHCFFFLKANHLLGNVFEEFSIVHIFEY
jgi:hypothetical protein